MDMWACDDKACVKFNDCYRATGPMNEYRQSYFMEVQPKREDGSCVYFIRDSRVKGVV